MKIFDYLEPRNVEETSNLLAKYIGEAKILAGGTDLLIAMRYEKICPRYVLDIKGIRELRCIQYNEKTEMIIGALSTIRDIEDSSFVKENFSDLKQAASSIGTPQIRNRGTIGGNLCNASPAADLASPLIALEAKVTLQKSSRNRTIRLEDFFIGPGQTLLEEGEVLTEIRVPVPSPSSRGYFLKVGRTKMGDLSAVNIAVRLNFEGNSKKCKDVNIVLGAVGPTPLRSTNAKDLLLGKVIDDQLCERAGILAAEECKPISDVRASRDYRKEMVKVLTKRAIRAILRTV